MILQISMSTVLIRSLLKIILYLAAAPCLKLDIFFERCFSCCLILGMHDFFLIGAIRRAPLIILC